MGIFMRLIDYTEDKRLNDYSLFSATLALIFLALFLLLKKERSIHSSTKFPIAGIESPGYFGLVKAREKFISDAFHIVKSGYHKYRGKNFVVTTHNHDRVILTSGQVKELSSAPDDTVSFSHFIMETMMGPYTGLGRFSGTNYLAEVSRIKLTRKLGIIKEAVIEEARFALDTELPECTTDEWKSVEIFTTVLRTVARTSSRVFIGLPLCRNEDWLTVAMGFTGDLIITVNKLASTPKLIRPFYAWMFNSTKLISSHRRKAQTLLGPIIQRRFEEERLAEENGTIYEKPDDMLQWFIDRVEPRHKNTEDLSELQLLSGLASVHATSLSFTNALYDLAAHQECVQPIREEIEAVISENNGVIDRAALRKMRKTDSFFKESARGQLNVLTFGRKILKNVTLSDGTPLKQGTLVSAPVAMFSSDPDLLEDPETFDGFRWYKESLEAESRAAHNSGWTTTSAHYLTFGHGKHACPGRFFVTEEMKILLTFIILQYDIKYPEGQSRPANIQRGASLVPDPTQKLLFKKLPGPKKFSFL
ncbi:cytochrome P450 [Tuber borchii]|uniref:Cytochrome P450 n=1 Tax=Tuber borchii TaxID=42251 RepID=A0A2T7A192_TUBBO|nr:cytochrome P450 [Tuber borchii]